MADNKIENSNLPKLVGFLSFKDRVDVIVRVLFGFFIAIGCFLVVWPFATAISVAAVIAIVSWPLFKIIRKWCGNRNLLSSFILVFLLTVLIVIPITGLSVVSAQQIPNLISMVREWISSGFSLPNEIKDIPWVGNWLYGQLDSLSAIGKIWQLQLKNSLILSAKFSLKAQ